MMQSAIEPTEDGNFDQTYFSLASGCLDDPEGNITIASSDKYLFRVKERELRYASQFFDDLLSTPQTEHIPLPHSAEDVHALLHVILLLRFESPRPLDTLETRQSRLESTIILLDKYLCERHIHTLAEDEAMRIFDLGGYPFDLFKLAIRWKWLESIRTAICNFGRTHLADGTSIQLPHCGRVQDPERWSVKMVDAVGVKVFVRLANACGNVRTGKFIKFQEWEKVAALFMRDLKL